jgi:cytochrome P450
MSETETRAATTRGCPHVATTTDEFCNNLHAVLDPVRAQAPIAWDETWNRYVTVGWATSMDVLRNWEAFTSAGGVTGMDDAPLMPPIDTDPPAHEDWRTQLNGHFTPKAVRAWEPATREVVRELISRFRGTGRADAMHDYADVIPGRIFFGEVMHLPLEDVARCQEWAQMVVGVSDHGDAIDGFTGLMGYVGGLVVERREQPSTGDVIDTVVHAQVGGELVSVDEAVKCLTMLILGGLETTTNTLGSSLAHLATHPEHCALLRSDPAVLNAAIDELLRLYSPTIGLCRKATDDVEIGGVTMRQGERVAVSYLAANHDPDQFEAPHEFRLDRENRTHLSFGYGRHFCLGAHLARMLLRVSTEEFLAAIPEFELAPGFTPRYRASNVWQLEALELVFPPS